MFTPEIAVAIAFVLFVIVVAKPVYVKLTVALDARADEIRRNLDEAQKLREEAQSALANYQRLQRDALKEAEAIVAHAKEEAARLREKSAADLEAALKRREEQAMDKIAQAEARALQDVRDQAVDLAMGATRMVIAERMDDAVRGRLVEDAIKDLPLRLQ